jgi:hypothetical protein
VYIPDLSLTGPSADRPGYGYIKVEASIDDQDQLAEAQAQINAALEKTRADLRAVKESLADSPEGREVATLTAQKTEAEAQAAELDRQAQEAQGERDQALREGRPSGEAIQRLRSISDSLGDLTNHVRVLDGLLATATAAYQALVRAKVEEERVRLQAQAEAAIQGAKENIRRALVGPAADVEAARMTGFYLGNADAVARDILGT